MRVWLKKWAAELVSAAEKACENRQRHGSQENKQFQTKIMQLSKATEKRNVWEKKHDKKERGLATTCRTS
jgi:predicted RNA-binding protein with RPS1 domain